MEALRAPNRRWLRAIQLAFGMGWLAGAFEMVEMASTMTLSLSLGQSMLLGVGASVAGALVGMAVALPVGLVFQRVARDYADSVFISMAMSATAFFLSGFYLWHAAGNLLEMERLPSALAMAACPIGVAGVVWFNAGYWGRREELGAESKLGWTGFAILAALLVDLGAGWSISSQQYGSSRALQGDPNVLLITLDTTRRDHISAYPDAKAHTPNLEALAQDGVLFLDAVTPLPETTPSHASMFTALHPLRHGVLSNADTLKGGHTTVAERLEAEGYATGAFLSSFAVSKRTGLDQGFQVYDDDFVPGARGFSRILLFQHALKVLMATGQPHKVPWMLERPGDQTVDLASAWIHDQGEQPWFAWVHLFDPHAPYEGADATVDHRALLSDPSHAFTDAEVTELRRLYKLEVEHTDALVGQLLAALDASGGTERTLVIVVGDHGEMLGEHDIHFHHHGLYDEVIRVPLILRYPPLKRHVSVIPQQVRVIDIAPTILKTIKLDPFDPTEGAELLGYAKGIRKKSLVLDLVGREGPALGKGCLAGLRTASKQAPTSIPDGADEDTLPPTAQDTETELRVKAIFHADGAPPEFYNLETDPLEQDNLAAQQTGAVSAAQARAEFSLKEMNCEQVELPAWEQEALKSLGYVED